VKSFHYAPVLGERTEAFICFSRMLLDHARLILWTWVFIVVIALTMMQRLYHTYQIGRPRKHDDLPLRQYLIAVNQHPQSIIKRNTFKLIKTVPWLTKMSTAE
jgi:hypothetical protein